MRVSRVVAFCTVLCLSAPAFAQDDLSAQEEGEVGASAEVSSDSGDSGSSGDASGSSYSSTEWQGGIKDRGEHRRPFGLSAMAYVPWYYGIGIGLNVRAEIPIVHNGFIPSINDQFSLEPSFSIAYRSRSYGYGAGLDERFKFLDITPALYGVWSFHITPKFRAYGALGLGYAIVTWLGDEDDYGGYSPDTSYFYWDFAAGIFYNFTESFSFRGELGANGPKAGIHILF